MLSFILVFATYAFAIPVFPVLQADTSWGVLGNGANNTPAYNFTLAAFDFDQRNDNSSSTPLVLAPGPPSNDPAASEWVLSANDSWSSSSWPYIVLQNGSLYPQPGPSDNGLEAYYPFEVTAGDEITFFVVASQGPLDLSGNFTTVADNSTYASLAVNGNANNFSLCTANTTWLAGNQTNLVYAPVADNEDYYYDTCYPVLVQLIPF